jgi:hypothetical protein
MKAQLLRRLCNLEIRDQAQRAPRKKPFPSWLIEEWQKQDVPINDHGVFDWAQSKTAAGRNADI